MIRFTDGPAAGVALALMRAPLFLRVVQNQGGVWDALDQLSDRPKPTEAVHVYRRVEYGGFCHVLMSRPRRGVWTQSARYELAAEQPDDETARDNERWRKWAAEKHAQEAAHARS